jgi:hypothetical protein
LFRRYMRVSHGWIIKVVDVEGRDSLDDECFKVIFERMGFHESVHGLFVGVFHGLAPRPRRRRIRAWGAGWEGRTV